MLAHKDNPRNVGNLSASRNCGGQNSSGIRCTGEEFILSAALSLVFYYNPVSCHLMRKKVKLCFLRDVIHIFKYH